MKRDICNMRTRFILLDDPRIDVEYENAVIYFCLYFFNVHIWHGLKEAQ